MSKHNELLFRVYFTMVIVVVCALLLSFKAVKINVVEGARWSAKGDSLYLRYKAVDAERGNILARDGRLLATSLPIFEVRMDLKAGGLTDEVFKQGLDSLALSLSKYVNKSWSQRRFRDHLIKRRARGDRYLLIARNVNYSGLERIKKFPIFRLGQNKGGLIVERQNKRNIPYGILAARTIGYKRPNVQSVGIEGYFDDDLKGKDGKRLMHRISTGTWIPVNNLDQIDAKRGADVISTIDIDIQDITESKLLEAVRKHNAQYGVAIVMEVATGAIRGIANLEPSNGKWMEKYNYAVGRTLEPGSTIKLATIMAMLEDDLVTLDTKVCIKNGYARFYNTDMYDSEDYGYDTTDLRTVFEISSNVGIAKTADRVYGKTKTAEKFIARLNQFGLNQTTGIEILGENAPRVKEAYNNAQNWSGISVPWMSIGYELELTPLQLLTFYNAVANDGKMMRPQLATAIVKDGKTIQSFPPEVAIRQIASKKTIALAQELLKGVAERGTARKEKSKYVTYAGKTGTAVIEYFMNTSGHKKHKGSFVGYFPADSPKYSCLVLIYNPKNGKYYGSAVALPVFVDIAEAITALTPGRSMNSTPGQESGTRIPPVKFAYKEDIEKIGKSLNVRFDEVADGEWIAHSNDGKMTLTARSMDGMQIPDLRGMGLRDVVFLLENAGLEVSTSGVGKVVRQSVKAGTKVSKGTQVQLVLG